VSFIPCFCIPYFQYDAEFIVFLISQWTVWQGSLDSYVRFIKRKFNNLFIERQHIYFYTRRFMNNHTHICAGLRQMNTTASIPDKDINKKERAHEVLDTIQKGFPSINAFSQRFFEACEKSFMAPCNLF
jgi:hypothetical protein